MDWKRKLSSRKFWIALIGFVTAILFTLNVPIAFYTKSKDDTCGNFFRYIVKTLKLNVQKKGDLFS